MIKPFMVISDRATDKEISDIVAKVELDNIRLMQAAKRAYKESQK